MPRCGRRSGMTRPRWEPRRGELRNRIVMAGNSYRGRAEVTWAVCELCGALRPWLESPGGRRASRPLCCGLLGVKFRQSISLEIVGNQEWVRSGGAARRC